MWKVGLGLHLWPHTRPSPTLPPVSIMVVVISRLMSVWRRLLHVWRLPSQFRSLGDQVSKCETEGKGELTNYKLAQPRI